MVLPYFFEYNAHTSIVRTWISHWYLANFFILFFKNNFKRNNHWKFIHHKSYLKPFISYLPFIVRREYFSIIFNAKKCALYLMGSIVGDKCRVSKVHIVFDHNWRNQILHKWAKILHKLAHLWSNIWNINKNTNIWLDGAIQLMPVSCPPLGRKCLPSCAASPQKWWKNVSFFANFLGSH